jgi:hypothetical protein
MIGTKYINFVQDLPYIIPTKEQFIVPPSFRGEEFFLNFSLSEKKFPWRPCFLLNQDEMGKSLRWPYIDALCKILLYLAQLVVSEEKVFRNWTPRNKNWLWRPCLLTDRDKMNNLHRGPFHRCFLTKFRFIWTSGFREDFLLIDQPETRFAYVRGHRGHDRIVVGFTTTCAISAYHH